MNKKQRTENRKPELKRETLRQLDQSELGQVAGGYWATLKYCAGTWYYTK